MIALLLLIASLLPAPGLVSDDRAVINSLLDGWHKAAAVADERAFFDVLGEESIYLGTDATERWSKSEFREWARPYFQRDTAWALVPRDRTVYLSRDGSVAWFEEYLDTRMGDCRGSGVLAKEGGAWKLAHYHLALTVPNDKVRGLMELIGGPRDEALRRQHEEIRRLLAKLFDGIRAGDSDAARSVFAAGATITRVDEERAPDPVAVDDFVRAIGAPRDEVWDERIWDVRITVAGDLGAVWANYALFVGTDLSHCGVDSFEVLRGRDGWRIVHLLYTRRRDGCSPPPPDPGGGD
ncbi:MAG: nuclear transport factor 2 family protein [Candidatus Krumholzibacteriia bacterium]